MLKKWFSELNISFKIALSFLTVIIIGSILLWLPISQLETSQAGYFDHLFTTVSMVCVTGLYTQPVFETYNLFGQIICILLMKTGGLGLLTIVASIFIKFRQRLDLDQSITLTEALNLADMSNFQDFIFHIIKLTIFLELVGALFLSFVFVPDFGVKDGLFTSLFVSVSAFNNAGFDNFGSTSLQAYHTHPIITIVIPGLIIAGGLGFSVWFELRSLIKEAISTRKFKGFRRTYHQFSLHTRLVLNMTLIMLVFGTVVFLFAEWSNALTIGNLSLVDKLQVSFFQSATMRTAGFATVNYTTIYSASFILFYILMFVGGSPGGTAGGVKTSSVLLIYLLIKNEIQQKTNISYQKHTIDRSLARKALVIGLMFIILVLLGSFFIAIFDHGVPLEHIIFEVISALATVGVSADLTPNLTQLSQSILMLFMFIGRIGPITAFAALQVKRYKKADIKYAKGNILIG